MKEIFYITGDATCPRGDGKKIIVHICNDKGRWGKGFVLALSAKWKEPEQTYREENVRDLKLGNVQIVEVEPDILVANMIAQHDTCSGPSGLPPIRYGAVRACLSAVNDLAFRISATLHMPRIGCGLAGGRWEDIEKIIKETCEVNVYVYDLPGTVHHDKPTRL
jgi:O-acetyl-ADP-ribose deacetylase (regulator of RNase III)